MIEGDEYPVQDANEWPRPRSRRVARSKKQERPRSGLCSGAPCGLEWIDLRTGIFRYRTTKLDRSNDDKEARIKKEQSGEGGVATEWGVWRIVLAFFRYGPVWVV